MFETISVRRYRYSIINDIFGIFYLPILWFSFYQFQKLFDKGYLGFNGFVCLVLVLAALALPFVWGAVWWKKERAEIEERFPFMTNRTNKYSDRSHLETSITYLYLIFCTIWLVSLYEKPIAQMALLIVTNVFFMGYLVISRPYSIHVNTVMGILWGMLLIAVEAYEIYFTVKDDELNSSDKTEQAYPLLIAVSVVMMIMILWSCWRVIWQFMDIWSFFSKT